MLFHAKEIKGHVMKNKERYIVFDEKMRSQLRQKQLEMLKLLISICEKHDLTYFIVGGTALGSIRHGGFIPWDDDIDVALPRKDYMTLMAVGQKELPPEFFLQNHNTEASYRNDFSKIRNSNTIYMEATVACLGINHGIYIDIFPIDGLPSGKLKRALLTCHKKVAKCYLGRDYLHQKNTWKRSIMIFVGRIFFHHKTPSRIIQDLEDHYMRYPYEISDIVVCHGGAWGKLEQCERAQYGQGVEGIFEGIKVRLPEKTHEYLSHKYGDYMQLPPEEKRVGHHYCVKFDIGDGK